METHITADIIYNLIAKLKSDGLNDAEIKKVFANSVWGDSNIIKSFQKETVFAAKKSRIGIRKRSIIYSLFGSVAIYLVLLPFLNESAANITCLIVALGLSVLLIIKLRLLFR